ncbi:MAG: chitosanase [Acidobacteriota bacterium]
MAFDETAKKKALAIVRIFETGKAAGDYAAVAVLDDGAGVSYGINQFTHRSGSLLRVVERYLASGSNVGSAALRSAMSDLRLTTPAAIKRLSANSAFRTALKAAAATPEMRAAQDAVAEELYLKPAIEACEEMGFAEPLSLAVVYDSVNHGGWEKIRDLTGGVASSLGKGSPPERQSLSAHRGGKPQEASSTSSTEGQSLSAHRGGKPRETDDARLGKPQESDDAGAAIERAWITTYVRKRDAWLASVKRLAATRYRTRFFLNQIAVWNWSLRLPLRVQGVPVTDESIKVSAVGPATKPPIGPGAKADGANQIPQQPSTITHPSREVVPTEAQPPDQSGSCLDKAEEGINAVAAKFDRVESMIESVVVRKDAAKSLWTTVAGTATQAVWALFGLIAGVPRVVWLVVAVIAGALMLGYLYRQIALGKMREMRSEK